MLHHFIEQVERLLTVLVLLLIGAALADGLLAEAVDARGTVLANGRAALDGDWLGMHGALSAPAWPVDEFRLYESVLAPGGSRYEPVVSYRLRA